MGKLVDQPFKQAHFIVESADDGTVDLKVSYPVANLEGPILRLLQKLTAKVPFLQGYLPGALSALFSALGVKQGTLSTASAEPVSGPAVVSDVEPALAHEAPPVEPAQ